MISLLIKIVFQWVIAGHVVLAFDVLLGLCKLLARRLSKSQMLQFSGATSRNDELPSAFCAGWWVVSSLENQIHTPKCGIRNFILGSCF